MEIQCKPKCEFMIQCLSRLGYGPITVRICEKCHYVIGISPEDREHPRPGDFLRSPREHIDYVLEEIPPMAKNPRRKVWHFARYIRHNVCPRADDFIGYGNCDMCSSVAQALRKEKELSDLMAKVIYE